MTEKKLYTSCALCASCAARTVGELLDTPMMLEAADGKILTAVCECCGKTKNTVVRYEVRRREPDGKEDP